MSVKGSISIKDNVTPVLQSVRKEQAKFKKDVGETKKAMQRAFDKKQDVKIDIKPATSRLKELTSKVNQTRNHLKAVGKMAVTPAIHLKNTVGAGISRVKGMISSLAKKVVIPVTVAAAAGAYGIKNALGAGMQLEQQQISMEHFIGATNKHLDSGQVKKIADEFTKELRENANATPFETGEVIAAGSRAVAITSGNTKEAMQLVTLAEDMAAASGGTKSISQAIEALADAKMGEMERLKEFGFKVSAEEFGQKGFEGVAKDLSDFYGGASAKLAKSGAGLLSTITGKLKSTFSDVGRNLLEEVKPLFEGAIDFIDKSAPMFEKYGTMMVSGITKGIEMVAALVPVLKKVFDTFKPIVVNLYNAVMPIIKTVIEGFITKTEMMLPIIGSVFNTVTNIIKQAAPIVSTMVSIINTAIETMLPVFQTIFDSVSEKVSSVLSFVGEQMGWIQGVFESVMPIVADVFETAWSVMSPILDIMITVFKALWEVVKFVFPAIQGVIETVWGVLKPIFDALAEALEWVGTAVESIVGWFGDVFHGVFDQPSYQREGLGTQALNAGKNIGQNALGTDNWKGGITWVGEQGPELLEVPKGSRILPNKQSARLMDSRLPVPNIANQQTIANKNMKIDINIPKIADSIVIREEADIDRIGETIVKKLSISKLVYV